MEDVYKIIREMEERIAELPVGYISRKTIKGKVHHYRQWRKVEKSKANISGKVILPKYGTRLRNENNWKNG